MALEIAPNLFVIEFRPTGEDMDPRYAELALALGQRVVSTVRKNIVIKLLTERSLHPLRWSQEYSPQALTVVCSYPGNQLPPGSHTWRITEKMQNDGTWQRKSRLASWCFDAAAEVFRGTKFMSDDVIQSGEVPTDRAALRQVFGEPWVPELGRLTPVNPFSFTDRITDVANEAFNRISGAEDFPAIHCSVEFPPATT